jgi:hypothetical protein
MCGLSSLRDQMRCTELGEMPTWRLMLRTLQRVRVFGGRVTSLTTRSIFLAGIEGLRPRPVLSLSPTRPDFSKRLDHIETVGIDVPIRSATSAIFRPSSRSRMICARKRSRCALVDALARRSSSARTSALAATVLIGRAIAPLQLLPATGII